jgi:uncharacterized membrane protein (UPF0127 family)
MRTVQIKNLSRPEIGPVRVRYCDTFFCRLRGFMFRRQLDADEALLFVQSRESRLDAAIHMLAVWTDLAVVWINDDHYVVDSCLARRWRPFYMPRRPARYILELAPEKLGVFQIGDGVSIEEVTLG